ncbi:hypothetical protein EJ08DRAFT_733951 [Tothia fuscella]|uniref:Uncharacterized protein n=1 Tax=Tothia fuscella TaxID=1048955 RepID=A0A9P4NS64_9PEZI|nr:hypothetical protein EJ08DRAFT_733951 [Tothia fuscella]
MFSQRRSLVSNYDVKTKNEEEFLALFKDPNNMKRSYTWKVTAYNGGPKKGVQFQDCGQICNGKDDNGYVRITYMVGITGWATLGYIAHDDPNRHWMRMDPDRPGTDHTRTITHELVLTYTCVKITGDQAAKDFIQAQPTFKDDLTYFDRVVCNNHILAIHKDIFDLWKGYQYIAYPAEEVIGDAFVYDLKVVGKEFDWKSIMLYPSLGVMEKKNVPEGASKIWGINFRITEQDIQSVKAMYPDVSWGTIG